jgi:cell division septation protein DedD
MSREPSYYEIALTHRQVVVFFVLVLACLMAAFLLGVWVGEGGDRPTRLADVRQAEGADGDMEVVDGVPADGSRGTPETEGLPEMSFFSDEDAGRSLREDLDEPAAAAPEPPPRRAEPEPVPTAASPAEPAEPAEPAAPAVTDRAAAPPPAARPSADAPRPSRPPSAGGVVIQVFSSDDQGKAQQILDRLLRADYDAHLSPEEVRGQVMYRVRVGPYSDRDLADEVAKRIEQEQGLDTWVTGS